MVKRFARLLFSLLLLCTASWSQTGLRAVANEPTLADEGVVLASSSAAADADDVAAADDAAEPQSVVVATDEEGQADARAVAQELLQLQAEQGGSIVPPAGSWPFNRENQQNAPAARRPQRVEAVVPEGWSQLSPSRAGHPGWDGRNIWELRLRQGDPRQNVWPAQQAAWNQPQPQREASPAEILRDSAWQLEVTAQRLEIEEFYEQADAVRQAAQHLRLESRKQGIRDSGEASYQKPAKQHKGDPSKEKPQKPEKHNRQNRHDRAERTF